MKRLPQPRVDPRTDRPGAPWVFRYQAHEIQPDGSVKVVRKYREIGPSKGRGALTRKQAEARRDELLSLIFPAKANSSEAPSDAETQLPEAGDLMLFGQLARLYMSGYLGRQNQVSEPTRQKEEFYIREYLMPKWGLDPIEQIQTKAVEDWLHTAFGSWWTMHGDATRLRKGLYLVPLCRGPRLCQGPGGSGANVRRRGRQATGFFAGVHVVPQSRRAG
jgi:hypothetical protein